MIQFGTALGWVPAINTPWALVGYHLVMKVGAFEEVVWWGQN